jgi:hypothetical protein
MTFNVKQQCLLNTFNKLEVYYFILDTINLTKRSSYKKDGGLAGARLGSSMF